MPNPGMIRRGESPKNKLTGVLGEALGMGLGEFTGQYLANKSLDEVLNDPSLKDAPMSERAGKLESAMRGYGKRGESILQKRLQIEQQAEQEKVQGVLAKYNKGAELTKEEEAMIPVAYRQKEMELKQKSQEQEILKEFIEKRNRMSSPAASPASSQPMQSGRVGNDLVFNREGQQQSPVQQQQQPIEEEKPWSPEEIEIMTVTNPTIANSMRAQNKEIDDRKRADIKTEFEREKFEHTKEKEGAAHNKDFINQALMGYDQYKANKARYGELDRLSTKGDLPKPALVAAFEKLGIPLGVLENADAEAFQKLALDLTTGINDDYRGRILEKEFSVFLQRIPQLSNSPEGRKQILENLKMLNELKRINYDAYKTVKDRYKGKALPFDFQDQVYDEKERAVDDWSKDFLSRMGRYEVAPGTQLTEDVIERYNAIANSPEEAARMAQEDGYAF